MSTRSSHNVLLVAMALFSLGELVFAEDPSASQAKDSSKGSVLYVASLQDSAVANAAVGKTDSGSAATLNGVCCNNCPGFYGLAEAMFLSRDNSACKQPVVINTELDPGEDTILTSRDLDFDYKPGVHAMLGYRFNECWAVEADYWGGFNWHASAEASGDNNLAIPGALGLVSNDFFDADHMRLDYVSRLNSVDINFVHPFCCCCGCNRGGCGNSDGCCGYWVHEVDLIAGFRYLGLQESFNIESTDLQEGTGNYNIRTTNDLYGAQIGARLRSSSDKRLGWEMTFLGGIFDNHASQRQYVTDFPDPFYLREPCGAHADQVAFVGQWNLSLLYRLNCVWSLRAGYSVFLIEGVALAPNQLDFTFTPTSGTDLDSRGSMVVHGANVGLEARW
jgi:hypothetical protein